MVARDVPVTRLLWVVAAIACVVLAIAGAGLLFLPDIMVPLWPWRLAAYTARALGAVYLAAFVSSLVLALRPWWSPARIVIPMIALFTVTVSVLSITGMNRYTNTTSTIGWLVLYVGVAATAVWHLWRYRGLPPAPTATAPTTLLRGLLLLQVAILGGYGALLLAFGSDVTGFWPWPIDDFHARFYSTAFLTTALGALLLVRLGTPLERTALGATQLTSGVCAIFGLVAVDAGLHRVDWSAPGTWLWLGLCLYVGLMGIVLLVGAIRRSRG